MRRRTENNGVSLFPFLAVLLCTMGSLILLLMLIAEQARTQGEKERAAARPEKPQVDEAALRRTRDDLEWDVAQLEQARDKTNADLAASREQLSHLEEHAQRLRQRLAELEAAEKIVASQADAGVGDAEKLQAELADLRRRIAEAEERLARAKAAGQKPQAFAVVPFDGNNGTRRRPIYIECRGDAVVLQPEGIVFRETDFAGPLGPGNPLAEAVRVASEYLQRTGGDRNGEQPYPLLLVRPTGIGAYYAARAAMSSWDSEFGYELIEEDWPLEFPPADPLLAQTLAQTVDKARARQVMIARAAPSLRAGSTKRTFGVSPTGRGIVAVDGGDASGGGRYGGVSGGGSYNPPRGGNGSQSGTGNTFGGSAGGAEDFAGSRRGGDSILGGPGAGPGDGGANEIAGSNATGQGPLFGGPQLGGSAEGGSQFAGSPAGTAPGGRYPSGNPPSINQSGGATGGSTSPGDGSFAAGSDVPGGDAIAAGSSAGGGGAMSAPSFDGAPNSGTSGSGGGASAGDPAAAGGSPTIAATMPAGPGEYVESLANKRGANWSLPEEARGSTPLTRPVQIYCFADGLTLLSDRGTPEQVVPLGATTQEAVDPLVAHVWKHVEGWGLAGRGMYWKPVLSMHIAPDGMARYNELRQLLEGSGLDVTGRPMQTAVQGGGARR